MAVAQGHPQGMGRDLACTLQQKDKTDPTLEDRVCVCVCVSIEAVCVCIGQRQSDPMLAKCEREI